MFFRFLNVFISFFLLFITGGNGQPKSIINHYSTNDGLADNRIRSVIKDSEGFMWVGSWGGLSRFDGRNFINFKSYPGDNSSLKNNRISELVDDKAGFIWVRTYDNQVYRFDKRAQKFLAISDLAGKNRNETIHFTKILFADKNNVWLQSLHHGILLVTGPGDKNPAIARFSVSSGQGLKLPSNKVLFFRPDHSGSFWAGTAAGLVKLSKKEGKAYRSTIIDKYKDFVYTNACNDHQDLWFTTAQGYVVNYKVASGKWASFKVSNTGLNNLYISKERKVYCTTKKGELVTLTADGKDMSTIRITGGTPLFSIYEDHSGLLWLEPEKIGVYKFDPLSRKSSYFYQENTVNYLHSAEDYKVYEDNKGQVWVYMKGCGFGYYQREKDQIAYFHNHPRNIYSKFSNAVTALYYDHAGVLWLSTDSRGLEKIVFQRSDFKQNLLIGTSFYQADNEVRSVFTDRQDRLWVGTKAGDLFVFKAGKLLKGLFINRPEKFEGIYCIFEDSKGRIWLGTKGNGLFMAQPADQQRNNYKIIHYATGDGPAALNTNNVYSILEDKKGRLWAGSYGDGLIRIQERNDKMEFLTSKTSFKNYPKINYKKIRNLAEDKDGNIWIATTDGLVIFDPNIAGAGQYRFFLYKKEPGKIESLGGDDVQHIFRDSKNNMWICTSSGGLNKALSANISKGLTFRSFTTKNGLPSDYILNCSEDPEGNLWLATQNGISKFSVHTGKFHNFGLYDGLSEVAFSEGASTSLKNGMLIFGSLEGYWSINPQEIGVQKSRANLALTNFQINNEDVLPGEQSPIKQSINNTLEIKLRHDENTISIDFGVLDYRLGQKDSYLYRLKGFDNDWKVDHGQRRATYTNLPHGDYVFEVKSRTEYLYDKVPQRSLVITIAPPYWKTWWAYLIYLLLAVALFLLIKRIAFGMLKLRQRIAIERKVADLKSSFFTQVSHELRTPLTLIMNPIEEVIQNENLSEKGKSYLNVVSKNSRRMVRFVNQLLDLRKVESGTVILKVSRIELVSFTKEITEYFYESIGKRNLKVSVDATMPVISVWADADKLDIIIYNLLSNAIKYSPENGRIQINIEERTAEGHVLITVADEGAGVFENELSDIFNLYYEGENRPDKPVKGTGIGLALSKELVEIHKGKIYAKRNVPEGLKVSLELQLGKEHFHTDKVQFVDEIQHKSGSDVTGSDTEPSLNLQYPKTKDRPQVLLVEDNDDLRHFIAGMLSKDYNVEMAVDGLQGLEKAKQFLPDLILTDIMMPGLDGIQLLDRLKSDMATSHIPVVLLTAKIAVESEIEALRYGADYYISKPFQMDLLKTVISSLIIQRKKLFKALLEGDKIEDIALNELVITSHDAAFLEKVIGVVEQRLSDTDFNIDDVADFLGMSRSAFFKKFKSLSNLAPVEFVRETRLNKAKKMFDLGEGNVSTVAYAVGFNNPKYFSTCFKAQFNLTPTDYLKKRNIAKTEI